MTLPLPPLVWLALTAVCASPAFAQTSAFAQDEETLELEKTVEAPTVSEGQKRFSALEKEANAVLEAYREAFFEADEAGRKELSKKDPMAPFVPRFLEGAEQYAGTEDAVPFLIWVCYNGTRSFEGQAAMAFMTLLETHGQSPALEPIAPSLPEYEHFAGPKGPKALKLLSTIAAKHPTPSVRGWATLAVHKATLENAALDSEAYAEAKQAVLAATEAAQQAWLSREVHSTLGIRETFSLGMVAPDIVGLDLDGVEFKLSDYRGQVIFLDFWGDW